MRHIIALTTITAVAIMATAAGPASAKPHGKDPKPGQGQGAHPRPQPRPVKPKPKPPKPPCAARPSCNPAGGCKGKPRCGQCKKPKRCQGTCPPRRRCPPPPVDPVPAPPANPCEDDPTGAGCPLAPCDPSTEECPADPDTGSETEPEPPPLVSDALGIHAEEALLSTPNGRHVRRCRVSRTRGGGFYSELSAGWQFSSARVRPCRPGRLSGGWTEGARFRVIREVTGELICKGLWLGYGSSTWYETTQGWVWSGATATARWVRC
jgi:hypothetical protein